MFGCFAAAVLAAAVDGAGPLVPARLDEELSPADTPYAQFDHRDGVWARALSLEEALGNSTTASIARSAARLAVGQPPSRDELCAFGRALPPRRRVAAVAYCAVVEAGLLEQPDAPDRRHA